MFGGAVGACRVADGAGDDPARAVPATGAAGKIGEAALLQLALGKIRLGQGHLGCAASGDACPTDANLPTDETAHFT